MAQTATSQDNTSTKNTLLVTGAIVLILIAVFVIYRTYKATQPHVVAHMNLPTGSSPKGQWLKAQKKGKASGAPGSIPTADPSNLNPTH